MESGQSEESKASSEEIDRPEPMNDDAGTGRFYECMFCKRGFSTAQALGGHMNIHRRDRAKIRQQNLPSVSNKPDEDSSNPCFLPQFPNYPQFHSPISENLKNYHMRLPTSTSGSRPTQVLRADNSLGWKPQQFSLFGEDLRVGPSTQVDEDDKRNRKDGELDLELRLGPEP